jgi:hypothetical protein
VYEPQPAPQIAATAGVPVDETVAVLEHLQVLGYAERVGVGWRLSAVERSRHRHVSTIARTGS